MAVSAGRWRQYFGNGSRSKAAPRARRTRSFNGKPQANKFAHHPPDGKKQPNTNSHSIQADTRRHRHQQELLSSRDHKPRRFTQSGCHHPSKTHRRNHLGIRTISAMFGSHDHDGVDRPPHRPNIPPTATRHRSRRWSWFSVPTNSHTQTAIMGRRPIPCRTSQCAPSAQAPRTWGLRAPSTGDVTTSEDDQVTSTVESGSS